VTVPYRPDFSAGFGPSGPDYAGASLAAWDKLAAEKGYRLVGIEPSGVNAFFIRNGLGEDLFPRVSVASCLDHPFARRSRAERLPGVQDRHWERV
jgi:hypothetical protein